MNFFDFAWSTALQMTKKTHGELKILFHDELRYPYLGKDDQGYVFHLITPKRLNERSVGFQGLKLNLQNMFHKKIIWYLFKSSVYHLSMHSILSDFSVYRKWAQGKQSNLSTFVISLLEDAVVSENLARSFRPCLPEIAFANAVSFLRMKATACLPNNMSKCTTSALLNYNLGRIKGHLSDEMKTDIDAVSSILKKVSENPTVDNKIDAATKTYEAFSLYGEAHEVPSLLYGESHGTNDLFYEQTMPKEEEVESLLLPALSMLGPEKDEERLKTALLSLRESEVQQALIAWKERENAELKILRAYLALGKETKFDDFEFPRENYAEYYRGRQLLSSPIRRVLHQLRLLKNVEGEDFKQESGLVDLQEAIQVIASKSQRTDIFVREELQSREDTWSILIDASHSLNMFRGEVRGIGLSLAEVAKTLILNQNSWGMYAFNNKFYIIKEFSERYDAHAKARIGGLSHGGLTYLPDAILLAAQALTKRLEESRVLVIVSDFFPAGYEEAEQQLKENIKKVERMGVSVIGIGVNSRAVKQYIRTSCVVEGPYDLMKKFVKAFIEHNS